MFGELKQVDDSVISTGMQEFKDRRNRLQQLVAEQYPGKTGRIMLFAPFEEVRNPFVQDSYFYYTTGLSEPAIAFSLEQSGESVLYAPQYGVDRHQWVADSAILNEKTIAIHGFDRFSFSGDATRSYAQNFYFAESDYGVIIALLKEMVQKKEFLFTVYPEHNSEAVRVKQIIDRLIIFVPDLRHFIIDISSQLNSMRRVKSMMEIETMYHALEITAAGLEAACCMLKPGNNEAEVHAAIEYVYTENGALNSYYPIVAGGKNATVLHYQQNNKELKGGDLVLIDAGAMFQNYCSDITRVYPVSGSFSDEQRELYEVVLEAQELAVKHMKPGMYLLNAQEQDASLHHIVVNFFKQHGYDKYFCHGIGHFLGLDTHDVGERSEPLQKGDVITIEPGVYIPDKNIGIRIEDNYWIADDEEVVCLSEKIPKSIKAVEEMMHQDFDIDLG